MARKNKIKKLKTQIKQLTETIVDLNVKYCAITHAIRSMNGCYLPHVCNCSTCIRLGVVKESLELGDEEE